MDKQAQDKLWNNLSETSKKRVLARYNEAKYYNDAKDIDCYEDLFGEHNLNPKQIKTWEDVEKLLPEDGFCVGEFAKYADNPKVTLKCQATLKIAKLIELGYGGMVSEEEWEDDSEEKYVITCSYKGEIGFEYSLYEKFFIAFHTPEQRQEFWSHESNRKLVEQYYMM